MATKISCTIKSIYGSRLEVSHSKDENSYGGGEFMKLSFNDGDDWHYFDDDATEELITALQAILNLVKALQS